MSVTGRILARIAAACILAGVACNGGTRLHVSNATDRRFDLRINQDTTWRIEARGRYHVTRRLPRGRIHQLAATDEQGSRHVHYIMPKADRVFVELREAGGGELEWWIGDAPPSAD